MVYGEFKGGKVNENTVAQLEFMEICELSSEMMVKSFSKIFNFPFTVIINQLYMVKDVLAEESKYL